jgi:hypothetical protein
MEGRWRLVVLRLVRWRRCGGSVVPLCILWGDRHRQVFVSSAGAVPSILGRRGSIPLPGDIGIVVTAHILLLQWLLWAISANGS